ncbi:LppP/LprE family lipoprotein [Curtobacterium herbarum]|uniref:LppP/LprE family lipoprotein n=1 Tax=Curtobacterium herbarum TaxID=150122 RepID=A0ABP4JZS7_9MICO|nr:LppP/LprE family lipoprotein [Curtobacterium herbarum]MBM7476347.1 hypothetical protein [Curtobacterium herbarum]MCS6544086.1 LppP/LprE family lipoprotein [Curtobacterium herbarum]
MGTSSRLRPAVLRGLVPLGLVSIALTGCSSGSAPAPTPTVTQTVAPSGGSTATPTAAATTPAPVQTPQPSATPTCGAEDPTSAIQQAADRLGPPAGIEGATWDTAAAERGGYDPCAALSWVVLRPAMSSGSSPSAILLFHDGTYLGTATKEQYSFEPGVTRTSDAALSVTYEFPRDGESNAEASGRATATYRWDDAAGRVVMTGDVPPTP